MKREIRGKELEAKIKRNWLFIAHVKEELQTDHLCKLALKQNGDALKDIYNKSYENCLIAVKNKASAFAYVPKEHHSSEIKKIALSKSGNLIKHVENPTQEDYANAMKSNNYHIENVPEEYHNEELYLYELTNNPSYVLKIPKEKRTSNILKKALDKDYNLMEKLENIPRYVYEYIVTIHPLSVEYLPEEYHNEDLHMKILDSNKENPSFYKWKINSMYIFKFFKNPSKKVCVIAVKDDSINIKYISKDNIDEDIFNAIEQPQIVFEYIPDKYKTDKFVTDIILKYPFTITKVKNPSDKLLALALNRDINVLGNLDQTKIPLQLLKLLIYKKPLTIELIQNSLLDDELIYHSIDYFLKNTKCVADYYDYDCDEHLYKSLFDILIEKGVYKEEYGEYAINKNSSMIQYMPDSIKSTIVCENAIYSDSYNIRYVPQEIQKERNDLCIYSIKDDPNNIFNICDIKQEYIDLLPEGLKKFYQ